jgi:hypothetical protein
VGRVGRLGVAAVTVAVFLAISGCDTARVATPSYPAYATLPAQTADPHYADAVDAAHAHSLRVWLESDLVANWRAGRPKFDEAIERIAALSHRPGVVGVKIADELGDHDGLTRQNIMTFLRDARAALHANAPGKLVLIDVIGYELGCAPHVPKVSKTSATCMARERQAHPAVTLATLDRIMRSGYVDVVDLSTNIAASSVYTSWGITRAQAQRAAFAEAVRRGWTRDVRLQTRKALAFPTPDIPDAQAAAALVPDFVDVPLAAGARGVDVWTYNQLYRGELVHLIGPGLTTNALWSALQARKRAGATLFTHYSPTFPIASSVDADMQVISTSFTDVFCAAGTG